MKPKPFASLNHFTVPVATLCVCPFFSLRYPAHPTFRLRKGDAKCTSPAGIQAPRRPGGGTRDRRQYSDAVRFGQPKIARRLRFLTLARRLAPKPASAPAKRRTRSGVEWFRDTGRSGLERLAAAAAAHGVRILDHEPAAAEILVRIRLGEIDLGA